MLRLEAFAVRASLNGCCAWASAATTSRPSLARRSRSNRMPVALIAAMTAVSDLRQFLMRTATREVRLLGRAGHPWGITQQIER